MCRLRPTAALFAATVLAPFAGAQVVQISDSVSISSMPTNWMETRSLDQFDPALGTLLSVRLTSEATVIGSAAYESTDNAPSVVSLNWSATVQVRRSDTNAILLTASPAFQNVSNLGPADGTIDFDGPSGDTFPNLFETDSASQDYFPPLSASEMALFIGTGTFDVDVTAQGLSSATGPGNVIQQFTTNASAVITVTYEYQGVLDCNDNGIPDDVDIANMTSDDCNDNGIPDECEFDCDFDGVPDDCDPDECPCFEYNRREPGSLLLYPEYRNGPGRVTVLTVTNANCDALGGSTEVEFRYINGETCAEANQETFLTPCDTYSVLTTAHTGLGEGYAYVYAKKGISSPANPAGIPHVFNHLTGQQIVIDAWKSLDYSVNAVSFKGKGLQGAPTDTDGPGGNGDGVRDLDDVEYEPAPDRLYIPRFLGQDFGPVQGIHSELVLVNLSGGAQFRATPGFPSGGTVVSILGYNDNEVVFSAEYSFSCWERVPLSTISSSFNNTTLRGFSDDPNEIAGYPSREAGWFKIDGSVASSTAESIIGPAIYAVLVEQVRSKAAADLPFEFCSQINGDLLPTSIFGDYPFIVGDNQ